MSVLSAEPEMTPEFSAKISGSFQVPMEEKWNIQEEKQVEGDCAFHLFFFLYIPFFFRR